MAREIELRSRVERLLRGDIRVDDLSRILLWLRFRTYGAASIKELGHFISHSDERNVGLVTDEARDFFFLLPYHTGGAPPPIDFSDVSSEFPNIISRNLNRTGSDHIKTATGMKRKEAHRILKSITDRFSAPIKGRRSFQAGPQLTPEQMRVLLCALGHLNANAAFSDETLFRDFVFALEKNNLISTNERPLLDNVRAPLALFAISAMHQTNLALESGSSAELLAGAGGALAKGSDALQVVAIGAHHVARVGGSLLFATPMFSTELKADEYCEPELLNFPDNGRLWHVPIEVTADLKLASL